jgi:hypothetical protein
VPGKEAMQRQITFKVSGLEEDLLKQIIQPLVKQIIDIRTCCM